MTVELSVFSEWEKVLTLYGWLLNNFYTDILFSSGIVLVVMIATFVSVWSAAADSGQVSQAMQRKLEMRTLIIVAVVVFAFFPIFRVDNIKVLALSGSCQEYGKQIAFEPVAVDEDLKQKLIADTADVKIPLLWALLHKIGAGIYYRVFDGLDCYTDWQAVETIIRTSKIQDPALADEYRLFATKCYGLARHQYQKTGHRGSGTPPSADDLAYLGSSYYLNTPGYYDAFLLPTQLHRWQPKAVRSCKAWWQGNAANKGLREILLEQATQQLPPLELAQISGSASRNLEDRIIKAMLKSNPIELTASAATHATQPSRMGLNLTAPDYVSGAGLSGLSEQVSATFNRAYFLKRIVSYAQPIVLLALYFFIPLFLLASSLKIIGVCYYAAVIAGVQAMPMIYAVVAALSAKVTESLYQGIGLFAVNMDRLIVASVFAYLPLVLAIAYFIALMLGIKRSTRSNE
ncbi:MAG: conjugal transfer protein TraG N-terminal domain-containing protein [Chromatiales bacterium]|nr:conjugal transfer protein TraG N-terminal domain-containing protein [Chromatiales bacterium]